MEKDLTCSLLVDREKERKRERERERKREACGKIVCCYRLERSAHFRFLHFSSPRDVFTKTFHFVATRIIFFLLPGEQSPGEDKETLTRTALADLSFGSNCHEGTSRDKGNNF